MPTAFLLARLRISLKMTEEWNASYLNARYFVTGEIEFRIGLQNETLDGLLRQSKAATWAFVTAFNPRSEQLTEQENAERNAALQKILEENNFRFLAGRGEGAGWQPEASFFILDIDRAAAIRLGKQFEQNAVVTGQIGKSPELVWCNK